MGGSGQATGNTTAKASAPVASTPDEDDVPFESAASAPAVKVAESAPVAEKATQATAGTDASARAQDILAMIRNRQKA
jgi:hypothetical protein